jgi:hypothetical protein
MESTRPHLPVGTGRCLRLTAEETQPVHELACQSVAALVGFCLLWAFVGSRYGRFAPFVQFVRGPPASLTYVAVGGESRATWVTIRQARPLYRTARDAVRKARTR